MENLFTVDSLISLLTLSVLEIVLGIDNIVFVSILAGKLPADKQKKARRLGMTLAMFIRVGLLMSISWIMSLTTPLFNPGSWIGIQNPKWLEMAAISGRDLILLIGGLFLIYKSTSEIHEKLEGHEHSTNAPKVAGFSQTIIQILLLDIVFSLDSVITAVGMADHIEIMIAAVIIAVGIMLLAAEGISKFVDTHPTVKMLALSFLLLIGVSLLAEAFDQHIPKGYIYFAMAFSVFIELLNLKMRAKSDHPVKLKQTIV
ncbi:TerC family protein [Chitinophaga sancti]|uniref:Membrane protein TerC, possibly involved in tellurium resistance n=1 Tax=Chitinophaga sancti TaxID=1004 RepID=A0A1K1QDI5_9BACT|nr:TerC family protein [Chitinophaga sancti]WQD61392.1 TerC family protein [Chitinophaga sancti]WQG93055.1 TerC family protein [Chitinophaga sancti]SFW57772.1 Membrane protein TerC, possibly involved in tellurium resistance [Chitinophaga sancti]